MNCIFISDVCVIVFVFFLSLLTVLFDARAFSYSVVRACLYHCVVF